GGLLRYRAMKEQSAVIVDGLQDPGLAQALSRRWMEAGIPNALDLAGQSALLEVPDEAAIERATGVAWTCGIVLRDRLGERFIPNLKLPDLRARMLQEYRGRTATA